MNPTLNQVVSKSILPSVCALQNFCSIINFDFLVKFTEVKHSSFSSDIGQVLFLLISLLDANKNYVL